MRDINSLADVVELANDLGHNFNPAAHVQYEPESAVSEENLTIDQFNIMRARTAEGEPGDGFEITVGVVCQGVYRYPDGSGEPDSVDMVELGHQPDAWAAVVKVFEYLAKERLEGIIENIGAGWMQAQAREEEAAP